MSGAVRRALLRGDGVPLTGKSGVVSNVGWITGVAVVSIGGAAVTVGLGLALAVGRIGRFAWFAR